MLGTKGVLKVTLLVVGVLVVGLGMYGVFHLREADAHKPYLSCLLKEHRADTPSNTYRYEYQSWVDDITDTTNCPNCSGMPPKNHTFKFHYKYLVTRTAYRHRAYGNAYFEYCHYHEKKEFRHSVWILQRCAG